LLAADGNNTIGVASELATGDYSFSGWDSISTSTRLLAVNDELRLRGAGNQVVTVGGFGGPVIASSIFPTACAKVGRGKDRDHVGAPP
jgi:hypothetical protein